MPRLIDADEMAKDLLTVAPQYKTMVQWCLTVLDAQPTIERRKTGKWIRWRDTFINESYVEYIPRCKCSECGREYDSYTSQFMNYCPQCGAVMRGDEE